MKTLKKLSLQELTKQQANQIKGGTNTQQAIIISNGHSGGCTPDVLPIGFPTDEELQDILFGQTN